MICVCVCVCVFFFLMMRRPPRSTQCRSSAASDVYKKQGPRRPDRRVGIQARADGKGPAAARHLHAGNRRHDRAPVSYTHLRAHETVLDLVCRLLLENKKAL